MSTIASLAPVPGCDLVDVGAGTAGSRFGLGALGARSVHVLDAMLGVLRERASSPGPSPRERVVQPRDPAWTIGHATHTWESDWLPTSRARSPRCGASPAREAP